MGFFSKIFGSDKPSEQSQFDILQTDGLRAMQIGEMPYAEKCFTAALELQHDLKTVGFLAEVYIRTQQHDKALPLLEELCRAENHPSFEVRFLLAITQGELRLFADERNTCKALLEEFPQDVRVLQCAAEADYGLDAPFEAIAHLTQELALEENHAGSLRLRAQILADMQQWNEALADTDTLVKAYPNSPSDLRLHARCLAALGRFDEAISDLEQVLTINPFDREAVLALGALYAETTRWDKALALYDEAIELQPDFAGAYKARGAVKHHLKDELGAADDLKRTLELAPETAEELSGKYVNVENEMNAKYRSMNPYGF